MTLEFVLDPVAPKRSDDTWAHDHRERQRIEELRKKTNTADSEWVVPAAGFEPTGELAEELIAYCGESMAAYKRPRWIEFVEELPKTATGKIRRFKLREAAGAHSRR